LNKCRRKSFTPSPHLRKISSSKAASASANSLLNPTSALLFSSAVPFKSRHPNSKYKASNEKYTYINRNPASTTAGSSTSNSTSTTANSNSPTDQQTASQIAFLNRNKNPAFAGKDTYYQSRFNFYNNSYLLNNNNNNPSTNTCVNSSNQKSTNNNSAVNTNPTGTNGTVNKSAILSHLNLNVKAREELEKRKQAAKQQQIEAETCSSSKLNRDGSPTIPITSYSSFNNEEDDDSESDSEEDKEKEEKIKFDLKKRKLDVLKSKSLDSTTNCGKKNKNDTASGTLKNTALIEEEDEEESSSYFNVFKSEKTAKTNPVVRTLTSKQLATLKTNVKKQPIVKQPILKQQPQPVVVTKHSMTRQPIIKSGQTQKDREEVTSSFIGKY